MGVFSFRGSNSNERTGRMTALEVQDVVGSGGTGPEKKKKSQNDLYVPSPYFENYGLPTFSCVHVFGPQTYRPFVSFPRERSESF